MTVSTLAYVVSAYLVVIALYGMVRHRNMISITLCVGVLQSSSYVLLLAIGDRIGGIAPFFKDKPVGTLVVDPVVQTLMLTDVVVEAGVVAVLLSMCVQSAERARTIDPNRISGLQG